jgi:hypothetical protein
MSLFPQQFPKYFTVDVGQPCPLCIQNFDLPVLPRLRAVQYDDGTIKVYCSVCGFKAYGARVGFKTLQLFKHTPWRS